MSRLDLAAADVTEAVEDALGLDPTDSETTNWIFGIIKGILAFILNKKESEE